MIHLPPIRRADLPTLERWIGECAAARTLAKEPVDVAWLDQFIRACMEERARRTITDADRPSVSEIAS